MADKNLETVNIDDVEILAAGTWHGTKTVTIPKDAIAAFVESFNELTANDKINYEPPAKLGHDDGQKLLQANGYPAAGWVASLKTKGDKLLASFKSVPKKLAEIIKAGGYKKVSAEFYQDYEIGGKKYPWVLKAVAFLGADVPAVKTIGDIAANYAEGVLLDENKVPYYTVSLGETDSLDQQSSEVRDAYYSQCKPAMDMPMGRSESGYVKEVFPAYIILDKSGALWQIPYTRDQDGNTVFDVANTIQVQQSYQPVTENTEKLAEWTTADVNNLPDDCFAVIKSGGVIDKGGMTLPRDLRMLPYKGADGKIDLPHLRNALARLPQADLTPAERSKAEKVLQAAAKDAGVGDNTTKNKEQEAIMEKEIRELLKLDEKTDVLEAVKALKAKAETQPPAVTLAEHQATVDKVKTLETKLAERERDERVGKAINAGKVTPAQKPWADEYAMKDPTGFDAFVTSAVPVVKLGEAGAAGNNPGDIQLTEAEIKMSEKLGVSREALIKVKQSEKEAK